MDEPFRRFEWHVASAYQWRDWLDERGRRIVVRERGLGGFQSSTAVERAWQDLREKNRETGPVLGNVEPTKWTAYSPMSREYSTLFLTFAELDYRDLNAISGFASKYGLLGLPLQEQHIPVPGDSVPREWHRAWGESHISWAREICLMREALHMTRSRTELEEKEYLAAWSRVGLEPPYDEDRRKLAWLFNLHLQQVQARIVLGKDVAPSLSFAPLTLLSAMWLQLALSVVGDKEFRACKFCRRIFEISTADSGYRKHREFCSDSCKTMDYRRRKRDALTLSKNGKGLAAISKEVGTSRATVSAWLKATRKKS